MSMRIKFIDKVASYIDQTDYSNIKRFDIKYGALGHLLFLYMKDKLFGNTLSQDKILNTLDLISNNIRNHDIQGYLFEQISDFGNFINILAKDIDYRKYLPKEMISIDNFVRYESMQAYKQKNIEPIDGILCGGYYFLDKNDADSKIELECIIRQLYDISIVEQNTMYWINESITPGEPRIYLGLTHGIVAIQIFVLQCAIRGVSPELCHEIIQKSYNFIIMNIKKDTSHSFFPIYLNEANDITRIEWAYGDLSIGYSLYFIETYLNKIENGKPSALVINIMEKCLLNENLNNVTRDFSLGYGKAGVSLIFRLFYEITKDTRYLLKSTELTDNILQSASFSEKYLGIEPWARVQPDEYLDRMSFVTGLSGIALNLITDVNPKIKFYKKFLYLM